MFPIKSGLRPVDALYRYCFSTLPLEYVIRRVQVNQDGLKVCGIYQPDDVSIFGGSVHTV